MVTRGWYAYRLHGRYYVFYNTYDSYPEGLGKGLVGNIPRDLAGYQTWLTSMRAEFAEQEENLNQNCLSISDEVLQNTQFSNSPGLPALRHFVNERLYHFPGFYAPTPDLGGTEWSYVIDLDREIFTIEGTAHFNLATLPDNWLFTVGWTKKDEIGIKTEDARIIASPRIASPPPDQELLREYHALRFTRVRPKGRVEFEKARVYVALLASQMYFAFVHHYESTLDYCLLSWTTSDLPFREFCYAVLCLASQSPRTLRFEKIASFRGNWKNQFLGLVRGSQASKAEFTSRFASGCHLVGEAQGSAPLTDCYWFEGVFVCLAVQLDNLDNYKQAMARVARQRNLQGASSFHAVIISMAHLVVLKVLPSGDIERTRLLTLFEIIPPITSTAITRIYMERNNKPSHPSTLDPPVVDEIDKDTTEEDVEADNGDIDGDEGRVDTDEGNVDENEGHVDANEDNVDANEGSIDPMEGGVDTDEEDVDAFLALAHVLGAAKNDRLKPTRSPVQGRLPAEIYKRVISFTNYDTWKACTEVSRNFRSYCQERWKLSEDLTLVGCSTSDCTLENRNGQVLKLDPLNPRKGEPSWEDDETFIIPRRIYEKKSADTQYLGVIGLDNGTSSFVEGLQLTVPSSFVPTSASADSLVNKDADSLVELSADAMVEKEQYALADRRAEDRRNSDSTLTQTMFGDDAGNVPLYELFTRYIPSSNTPATSQTLCKVFDYAIFRPYLILGHAESSSRNMGHSGDFGLHRYGPAWEQPRDTCLRLHERYGRPSDLGMKKDADAFYAIVWINQCSQDTPAGWARAIERATSLAKPFVGLTPRGRDRYSRRGDAIPSEEPPNFVVLVIIGAKMTLFQVDASVLRLPPLPPVVITEEDEKDEKAEWDAKWRGDEERRKEEESKLDIGEKQRRAEKKQKRVDRQKEQIALERTWWETVREQVVWRQEPKGVFDVTEHADRAGVAEVMKTIQVVAENAGPRESQG